MYYLPDDANSMSNIADVLDAGNPVKQTNYAAILMVALIASLTKELDAEVKKAAFLPAIKQRLQRAWNEKDATFPLKTVLAIWLSVWVVLYAVNPKIFSDDFEQKIDRNVGLVAPPVAALGMYVLWPKPKQRPTPPPLVALPASSDDDTYVSADEYEME